VGEDSYENRLDSKVQRLVENGGKALLKGAARSIVGVPADVAGAVTDHGRVSAVRAVLPSLTAGSIAERTAQGLSTGFADRRNLLATRAAIGVGTTVASAFTGGAAGLATNGIANMVVEGGKKLASALPVAELARQQYVRHSQGIGQMEQVSSSGRNYRARAGASLSLLAHKPDVAQALLAETARERMTSDKQSWHAANDARRGLGSQSSATFGRQGYEDARLTVAGAFGFPDDASRSSSSAGSLSIGQRLVDINRPRGLL
jgi:hypothetical protein